MRLFFFHPTHGDSSSNPILSTVCGPFFSSSIRVVLLVSLTEYPYASPQSTPFSIRAIENPVDRITGTFTPFCGSFDEEVTTGRESSI